MALLHRHRRPADARGWLPPPSIATIIGIVLFGAYVGSAMLSALPFGRKSLPYENFGGVGALYTATEEAAYCSKPQPDADACFLPAVPTNRTIYMQPYGGLGNRLRAVASALTLGASVGANVIIVWTEKEHGFRGRWDELFASPRIPMGCFPGPRGAGVLREDHAACSVHRVNHASEWEAVKGKFERQKNGQEVLCMQSMMFLTPKQRGVGWFYRQLRPAAAAAAAVAAFQRAVNWDAWGQWVGVHIRRTDLKLKCNTDDCSDGLSVEDVLPISKYTDLLGSVAALPGVSGTAKTRFFLATDDAKTENAVRAALVSGGMNITAADVVSYAKAVRDSTSSALAMRSSASGTVEAVVDLWLLSQARVLVGTVGSSYSQTARLMGAPFFLSVGVEYENRL